METIGIIEFTQGDLEVLSKMVDLLLKSHGSSALTTANYIENMLANAKESDKFEVVEKIITPTEPTTE